MRSDSISSNNSSSSSSCGPSRSLRLSSNCSETHINRTNHPTNQFKSSTTKKSTSTMSFKMNRKLLVLAFLFLLFTKVSNLSDSTILSFLFQYTFFKMPCICFLIFQGSKREW